MAQRQITFDESVAILEGATKKNQKNLIHTWYGWVSKDVMHITSKSGAVNREIWHFAIKEYRGGHLYFVNKTSTAYVFARKAPKKLREEALKAVDEESFAKCLKCIVGVPVKLVDQDEIIRLTRSWTGLNGYTKFPNGDETIESVLGEHREYTTDEWREVKGTHLRAYRVNYGSTTNIMGGYVVVVRRGFITGPVDSTRVRSHVVLRRGASRKEVVEFLSNL